MDFCPGFGCILPHDVVSLFVEAFSYFPLFPLDDVYVGVLSNRNGVSATNNNRFEVWNPPGLGGECQMKIETFVTSWLIIINMR